MHALLNILTTGTLAVPMYFSSFVRMRTTYPYVPSRNDHRLHRI